DEVEHAAHAVGLVPSRRVRDDFDAVERAGGETLEVRRDELAPDGRRAAVDQDGDVAHAAEAHVPLDVHFHGRDRLQDGRGGAALRERIVADVVYGAVDLHLHAVAP